MNKKVVRTLSKILTLLMLVLGTITIIESCNKIVGTTFELLVLRDNALYYNSLPIKSEKLNEEYDKNDTKRKEIYNSEDTLIRTFSNQNALVKVCICVIAILTYPLVFVAWARQMVLYLFKIRRKIIKTKRNPKSKKIS